jgi:hypothetical protein
MRRLPVAAEMGLKHLPRAPLPEVSPGSFAFVAATFPAATIEEWLFRQWVYTRAFEQAVAVVTPSLLDRDLLGVWN